MKLITTIFILILILILLLLYFFKSTKENFEIDYYRSIHCLSQLDLSNVNNKHKKHKKHNKHNKHELKCYINKHLQRKCYWSCKNLS